MPSQIPGWPNTSSGRMMWTNSDRQKCCIITMLCVHSSALWPTRPFSTSGICGRASHTNPAAATFAKAARVAQPNRHHTYMRGVQKWKTVENMNHSKWMSSGTCNNLNVDAREVALLIFRKFFPSFLSSSDCIKQTNLKGVHIEFSHQRICNIVGKR